MNVNGLAIFKETIPQFIHKPLQMKDLWRRRLTRELLRKPLKGGVRGVRGGTETIFRKPN
jgi:hypothetical protein